MDSLSMNTKNGEKATNDINNGSHVHVQKEDYSYKRSRSITEYIDDFGSTSTHHGLRFVTNSHYNIFRRIFWIVVVLIADAYLALTIIDNIERYYLRDVNTLVSVEYVSDELDFPAVTLCNYNQWRKSQADEETLLLLREIYGRRVGLNNDAPFNWTRYSYLLVEEQSDDFLDFVLNTTHQIKDMLFECTWRGGILCDWRNFTTTLTDWGVCYTFNHPANRSEVLKINQPGMHSGLFLRLSVEQDEYLEGEHTGAGFKVLLHKQGVRPLLKELGFAVSPGFETLVTVNYEKVTNLPDPFTDCVEKDEDDRLSFFSDNHYTVPLCNHDCKVKYVVDRCGCRDFRYPGDMRICNPKEMQECILVNEERFYTENVKCDCPASCYSEKFGARTSIAYFPNDYLAREIEPIYGVTQEWMRKNVLEMRIFFEELSYSSVKQTEAYTKNDLISDIGGNMGLMAGMSLITILEAFDFIIDTIWKKFFRV